MTTLAGAASAVDGTWIISLIRDILTKRQTDLDAYHHIHQHYHHRIVVTRTVFVIIVVVEWPGWMFCYNTVQSVHSHMSIVVPHAPRDTHACKHTHILSYSDGHHRAHVHSRKHKD